ncbi:MAG: DUF5680 domain-containing protein [Dehalococcoidia bacterium]
MISMNAAVDADALKAFLLESNRAGYAGGDEKKWIREGDGSLTIVFEDGSWRSHDNFFGGEPYGGRTVVFHEGQPVWMIVYYGWADEGSEPESLYGILKKALKEMPSDAPYRGPRRREIDSYVYTNQWDGALDRFAGREEILEGQALVYQADYAVGLVDKRKGV